MKNGGPESLMNLGIWQTQSTSALQILVPEAYLTGSNLDMQVVIVHEKNIAKNHIEDEYDLFQYFSMDISTLYCYVIFKYVWGKNAWSVYSVILEQMTCICILN